MSLFKLGRRSGEGRNRSFGVLQGEPYLLCPWPYDLTAPSKSQKSWVVLSMWEIWRGHLYWLAFGVPTGVSVFRHLYWPAFGVLTEYILAAATKSTSCARSLRSLIKDGPVHLPSFSRFLFLFLPLFLSLSSPPLLFPSLVLFHHSCPRGPVSAPPLPPSLPVFR